MARIIKFRLKNGVTYGICMTNKTVIYDDGLGPITYYGVNGFDPSTIDSDVGYSVDNAEGRALVSDNIPGVTLQMVRTGQLENARWYCYLIDYNAPTPGMHALLGAGDVGQVYIKNGLIYTPELLSYMNRLKQPVGLTWSKTCRAIFGTRNDTPTGCGVNAEAMWKLFTVKSSGAEPDRTFTADISHGEFYPGRVEWLTGNNAGKMHATEECDIVDGFVVLSMEEPTPYDIIPGDTGRIRPDCGKTPEFCHRYKNWPNYKGEPTIPTADSVTISVPGASG